GPVIQQHATPALEAALGITQEPFPSAATGRAFRTTPTVFGRGLLDAVPDAEILAREDPDARDGDGISGRPNRTAAGRAARRARLSRPDAPAGAQRRRRAPQDGVRRLHRSAAARYGAGPPGHLPRPGDDVGVPDRATDRAAVRHAFPARRPRDDAGSGAGAA